MKVRKRLQDFGPKGPGNRVLNKETSPAGLKKLKDLRTK